MLVKITSIQKRLLAAAKALADAIAKLVEAAKVMLLCHLNLILALNVG